MKLSIRVSVGWGLLAAVNLHAWGLAYMMYTWPKKRNQTPVVMVRRLERVKAAFKVNNVKHGTREG